MLFSVVNMKLRDFYPSLDGLCDDMGVDRIDLEKALNAVGYEYDEYQNKFILYFIICYYELFKKISAYLFLCDSYLGALFDENAVNET